MACKREAVSPSAHNPFCRMDSDSGYVAVDEETGDDRTYVLCKECPDKANCSKASWARVAAWSYKGEDAVEEIVKKHLRNSDLHRHISEEEFADAVFRIEYQSHVETAEDRKQYREMVDHAFQLLLLVVAVVVVAADAAKMHARQEVVAVMMEVALPLGLRRRSGRRMKWQS